MKDPILFDDHVVLKEVSPMPDRADGARQILFRAELPDRGAGYTTPQLLKAWKREVLEAKKRLGGEIAGAVMFLAGPLAAGMELFFADCLSRNARAVFRQLGQTQEFVLSCGIEPDPDVQEARTVSVPAEALTGFGRVL
jgi:hypothetical protein